MVILSKRKVELPCFENVVSQMIKNIYFREKCTYENLEMKIINNFNFRNNQTKRFLEFKDEIYLVFKYLKMIQFIYNNSDDLISISLEGSKFLNKQSLDRDKLDDIEQLVHIKDYFNYFDFEIDPIIVSYKQLVQIDKEKVEKTLKSFYCSKDLDIQNFVRNKIDTFDDKSICRAYFMLDQKNSDDEIFYILGFYALSLKTLNFDPNKVTEKQREDMNLLKKSDSISSYFIAQLGKNDMFKYNFDGNQLLDEAVSIIYTCIEKLGGTLVWLEANKNAYPVIDFYKEYGFMEIQSELQDDEIERIQLMKFLNM